MVSIVDSVALNGIQAVIVKAEVTVHRGLPAVILVGLGDRAVAEARERSTTLIPQNSKSEAMLLSDKLLTQKERFNQRFPQLNLEYYTQLTQDLLSVIYPKECPNCNTLLTKPVKGRETAVRCPKCHTQGSRTAYTPLHHLKLPLWVFGYLLSEAIELYPQVLTTASIKRRLKTSNNASLLLKRRLQLFLTDLIPAAKKIMSDELSSSVKEDLPDDLSTDLSNLLIGKKVLHMDTIALFSASQRANGGRARYKHGGQTASIYLSDSVAREKGKLQIGTLVHTMAVKGGGVILDSIPDQRQRTIQPHISYFHDRCYMFTDQGYPWLSRYYPNHRSINHSAKAKDKRNRWARDRWCKNGVHNQVAEGFQKTLKHSFIAGYGYIRPKYSQLYLNEFSMLKNIRSYGIGAFVDMENPVCVEGGVQTGRES